MWILGLLVTSSSLVLQAGSAAPSAAAPRFVRFHFDGSCQLTQSTTNVALSKKRFNRLVLLFSSDCAVAQTVKIKAWNHANPSNRSLHSCVRDKSDGQISTFPSAPIDVLPGDDESVFVFCRVHPNAAEGKDLHRLMVLHSVVDAATKTLRPIDHQLAVEVKP